MLLELIVIVKDIITTLTMTKVKVEHQQTRKVGAMDLEGVHIGIGHTQMIKDISIYLYHETTDIVYRSGHQKQMIMLETIQLIP